MTVGVSKFNPVTPTVADDFTTVPMATNQAVNLLMGNLAADGFGNAGPNQTIVLYDASAFPQNGGWVSVGTEIISYTGISGGNTLTGIARGQQGTVSKAHPQRSPVAYNFTALHMNVLAQAIFNAQQAILNLPVSIFDSGSTSGGATLTLTQTPRGTAKIILYINGVFYTDGVDFTRVSKTLTFSNSPYPPAGNAYVAIYPS